MDGGSRALPEQVPARRIGVPPLRAGCPGPPYLPPLRRPWSQFEGALRRLTIDRNIHTSRRGSQAAVEKYNARAGMAVVLSPGTGEILADGRRRLRSTRTSGPRPVEARKNVPDRQLRARIDFKVFTLASALELEREHNGSVSSARTDPTTTQEGDPRHTSYGGLPRRRWSSFSSNIGITKINDRMDGTGSTR